MVIARARCGKKQVGNFFADHVPLALGNPGGRQRPAPQAFISDLRKVSLPWNTIPSGGSARHPGRIEVFIECGQPSAVFHRKAKQVNIRQALGIRERRKEAALQGRNIIRSKLVPAIAAPCVEKDAHQFRRTGPPFGSRPAENAQHAIFGQRACRPSIRRLPFEKTRRRLMVHMALVQQGGGDIHIEERRHGRAEARIDL